MLFKKHPPVGLVVIVLSYLILQIVQLFIAPSVAITVRFIISVVIGLFMLRGNWLAIFIWIILSILATMMVLSWAFSSSQSDPEMATVAAVVGVTVLGQALYLMLSKSVKNFIQPE